ncbi:MAG: ParB N-terminal domain-containing protein [Agriterribacter sp.]
MKDASIPTKMVRTSRLKLNIGQVPGLPRNPRFIRTEKFERLQKSIQDHPEMLHLREIIAYDNNGELIVIAGNMRLRACIELGIKQVPVKILPSITSVEQLQAYTIKDNVRFGENDWDALANEWDETKLTDWGMDIPAFKTEGKEDENDPINVPIPHFTLKVRFVRQKDCQDLFEELAAKGMDVKIIK